MYTRKKSAHPRDCRRIEFPVEDGVSTSDVLNSGLPSVANARLPQIYEAAKKAISECFRIDECKDWANKAEALASFRRSGSSAQL